MGKTDLKSFFQEPMNEDKKPRMFTTKANIKMNAIVAIGKPERHMRKASHFDNKQQ